MSLDGEPVRKARRLVLTADVNDVVVAQFEQLVAVKIEELRVVEKRVFRAEVYESAPDSPSVHVIATTTADTVWAALRDCADQVERAAARPQT